MSLEVVSIIIAVVSFLVSLVAAGAAVKAVLYSREQVRLAREQAELRPEITIFVDENEPLRCVPASQRAVGGHYTHSITFMIKNTGKAVAHNVNCKFQFDEKILEPVDYGDFHKPWVGPEQVYRHDVKLRPQTQAPTKIRYSAICDEVGKVEGVLKPNINA